MSGTGNPREHPLRVSAMAKANGISLTEAMAKEKLTQFEYAQMIQQCRRCPRPGQCQMMLRVGTLNGKPPEFCMNRDMMTKLRDA